MRLALALILLSACSDTDNKAHDAGVVCGDGGDERLRHADVVGCNVVNGFLDLGDDFATDVDDLRELREVTGTLNIFRSRLTTLDGLANLERVGGNLFIHNTELSSLAGLRSLRRVGGDLLIVSNLQLPQPEVEAFAKSLDVKGNVQTESTVADE